MSQISLIYYEYYPKILNFEAPYKNSFSSHNLPDYKQITLFLKGGGAKIQGFRVSTLFWDEQINNRVNFYCHKHSINIRP